MSIALQSDNESAASEAGRALNAMRRTYEKKCGACGKHITGVSHRKWCDPTCAKRGERMRKAAAKARVRRFLRPVTVS